MGRYEEVFRQSIKEPAKFWEDAAGAISWYKKWDKVLDDTNSLFYRWFRGGELNTCYNALDRHVEAGRADQDGYVYVMGRVDDVINVAGHRLSTGEMEEILATHPDVAECAVIGVADSLKGQLPLGLVVLKAGVDREHDEIKKELSKLIREQIGPIACYKETCIVARLPKTRSGKILRGTMRKIADAQEYTIPSTIDDPAILGEIEASLKAIGYENKHS